MLIVDKPFGVTTQKQGSYESLTCLAKQWVKNKYNKKGNVFLEPIHRLDKGSAGLVIFARTSKALSRLQEQMRGREIEKIYYAYVEKRPPQEKGLLEHYLFHGEGRSFISSPHKKGAKRALLDYFVLPPDELAKKEKGVKLEVHLHTGRYHQIRSQLSAIGSPILGDKKYGSSRPFKEGAVALYHVQVTLTHPITKERVTFTRD